MRFVQITVANLGSDYPMLAGNMTSFLSSGIILVVVSLIKPEHYDFSSMQAIEMVDETGNEAHVVDGAWGVLVLNCNNTSRLNRG